MFLWHPAYRWRELSIGICTERENLRHDVKRKLQASGYRKKESIEAWHRGGVFCSSVETFVMEVERRENIIWFIMDENYLPLAD